MLIHDWYVNAICHTSIINLVVRKEVQEQGKGVVIDLLSSAEGVGVEGAVS